MTESGQLPLAGFDDIPVQPSDRLFFAIRPDAEAMAHIERLVRTLCSERGLKGRSLGRDRFHVTLHHIGDFAGLPAHVVDAACAAAASVTTMPPFTLEFDRVASFSRRARNKPLVLLGGDGLLALKDFQRALDLAMVGDSMFWRRSSKSLRGQGLSHRSSHSVGARYTPHLTLLYDDRHIAEQKIEPITWVAREFVLVRSLIGQSRHEVLASLPLRGE